MLAGCVFGAPDDVWGFERGVLAHAGVRDALALRVTCREGLRVVTRHFALCKSLPVLASRDIHVVCEPRLFPNFIGFGSLRVSGRLHAGAVRALTARWRLWKHCEIDTGTHSRKALAVALNRLLCAGELWLQVRANALTGYGRAAELTRALFCFLRRNRQLQRMLLRSPSLMDTGFLRVSALQVLHVECEAASPSMLAKLACNLPPSLRTLSVRLRTAPQVPSPRFLLLLARNLALDTLVLENCLCRDALTADPLECVNRFLSASRVRGLAVSSLTFAQVDLAASRGVLQSLATVATGRAPHDVAAWTRALPVGFGVVTCC